MPLANRSQRRKLHIFDASDPATEIGGIQNITDLTHAQLYYMGEIWLFTKIAPWVLQKEDGVVLAKDNSVVTPGNYYVHADEPLIINDDAAILRTYSMGLSGTRTRDFTKQVQKRDQKCVITGVVALGAADDDYEGFQAAHIFPLAREDMWVRNRYARWLTTSPNLPSGTINSVQNGMLISAHLHLLFDSAGFSINPDDGFKIYVFRHDSFHIHGKQVSQDFLDHPMRPPDQLLRWHFHQAVFINMRGAGEAPFEHDFPPGSDMMGQILAAPHAAERMELEMFTRLAIHLDLTEPELCY